MLLLLLTNYQAVAATDTYALPKHHYLSIIKGLTWTQEGYIGAYLYDHQVVTGHRYYRDIDSEPQRGLGIAYGYSVNPKWSFEIQYQYIGKTETIAYKGGTYRTLFKSYEVKNDDNKTTIIIYALTGFVRWNYAAFANKLYLAFSFGWGNPFYEWHTRDGNDTIEIKNNVTDIVLEPFGLLYRINDDFSVHFRTGFDGFFYRTANLGVNYYFY